MIEASSDIRVVIVTVVRDRVLYNKYVLANKNHSGVSFVALDNTHKNLPITVRYNAFLDDYDYSNKAWFVFCHEDFEFLENPSLVLKNLSESALYGPIGHIRVGALGFGMQRVRGEVKITKKNEDVLKSWRIGRYLRKPARVETFDCCCLMVHSSLVNKFTLRFDEKLEFDMYVEDFCAAANEHFKISSFAVQMDVCHHSDAVATERLWRHLPYLAKKYKKRCYTGTLTYFGTPTWQKRIQDRVINFIRRKICKKSL